MQKSSIWLAGMFLAVPLMAPISLSAQSLLRPGDKDVVVRGAEIYAQQCASCHGKNLEGQPNWRSRLPTGRMPAPPHDESGHTWHHNDRLLFRLTKEGPAAVIGNNYQSDMKGYAETLSDRDIIAVLSYIKSRWPSHVRARHDRINEAQR
ncbi:c-type cytochrome [bacterium]|nr:c-type cytochrome [bacterium]